LGVTQVITVTEDDEVGVTSHTARYTYDVLGRRSTSHADGGTTRYLYTGGRVLEERDETDALLATYVTGLTMDRGGIRVFYQTDALGSTRAIADDVGNVVERVDYDLFGAPTISAVGLSEETSPGASMLDNPYLFRGRRYDADVVLYVYGGRRYDPGSGRYTQRGMEAWGNPYTFADNNPTSFIRR
jgi:RHS repeat-associated protein